MTPQYQYGDSLEMNLMTYQHDSERVETAMHSLESIMHTQDMLTDGNKALDETTYKVIEHSIESFLKIGRIGDIRPIVPSNESFKGNYDISEATMEGIGEGIKNVFLSIINAIKKAFEWVWGLIKRLFGLGKNHDAKLEKLEKQKEQVKEKVAKMTPEQKQEAPYPRDSSGWFETVKVNNPKILRNIVTSKGMMTQHDLNKYTTEMSGVFSKQNKNMQQAMLVKNGYSSSNQHYDPPFPPSNDSELLKHVRAGKGTKLHASLEFGDGAYIYVLVPELDKSKLDNEKDAIKETNRWVDGLVIGHTRSSKIPDLSKYTMLKGEQANPDKILENIKLLNNVMQMKTDELKNYQTAKEHFMRDFEAMIKQEGVTLFSSSEKKAKRDSMMFQLKFFKKVMDQPALTYYGMCEGILSGFEHLATQILAFNHRNGNIVDLAQNAKR